MPPGQPESGLLFVLAASFNGGAFLTYSKDLNSLLITLFFVRRGDAVLCQQYLPAAAPAPRPERCPGQRRRDPMSRIPWMIAST